MKILFINQFFWPDAAATGQFLEDLVRHLGAAGHQITVIASGNPYADAAPADALGSVAPPARILRVRGAPFARSVSGRALSYLSFFAGAFWRALRCPRHDVVVTMTTPPLLSVIGETLQRLRGTQHYIWEMDLFPDAFVSLKAMRPGSFPDRALGFIADHCRRRSQAVIALGPCMEERLRRRGIPPERIHVADNWADGEEVRPLAFRRAADLHILYSGNLGLSHDTGTIAGAIDALREDRRFRFTFTGGGAGREALEARYRGQEAANVAFQPYASRQDLAASLGNADIGLVTLRPECSGTVVPSKVYGLMAAARPILFVGPADASAALLIERHACGWRVDAGDTAALVDLLHWLERNRIVVQTAGMRARKAFEAHYDIRIGLARIANILGLPSESYANPKGVSTFLEA